MRNHLGSTAVCDAASEASARVVSAVVAHRRPTLPDDLTVVAPITVLQSGDRRIEDMNFPLLATEGSSESCEKWADKVGVGSGSCARDAINATKACQNLTGCRLSQGAETADMLWTRCPATCGARFQDIEAPWWNPSFPFDSLTLAERAAASKLFPDCATWAKRYGVGHGSCDSTTMSFSPFCEGDPACRDSHGLAMAKDINRLCPATCGCPFGAQQ